LIERPFRYDDAFDARAADWAEQRIAQ
jgi:hypothetical protein